MVFFTIVLTVNWISSIPLIEIAVHFKRALICFKGGLWTGLITNYYLASCFHSERSETLEWLPDMPSVFMYLYVYTRFLSLEINTNLNQSLTFNFHIRRRYLCFCGDLCFIKLTLSRAVSWWVLQALEASTSVVGKSIYVFHYT